jgi:AP-1-like factor
MESMDYNNYFAPAPHTFGYLGFGNDATALGHGAGSDNNGAVESMETSYDANSFIPSAFDYNFDASVGSGGNASGAAQSSSSASPIAQHISLLPSDSFENGIALDLDDGMPGQDRRSNSVDKELLTPAQSRRKAQNRAAQRAFRERKERHVRDLETKLNLLTTTTSSLQSDNERLKLLLQRTQTENEILKATASSSPPRHHTPTFVDNPSMLSSSRATKSVSPDSEPSLDHARLANGLLSTESSTSSHTSPQSDSSHLLSTSATWDLLQSHPLYLRGALDIGEVCERLKHMARCNGTGPVFDEHDVRAVIEEVGGDGNDQLI